MISTMMRTSRTEPTAVPGVFPAAAAWAGGRTSKATVGVGEAQAVLVGAVLCDGDALCEAVPAGEAVPDTETLGDAEAAGVQVEAAAG